MAKASQTRVGDLTGRKKADLAEKHAAEQEAAAKSLALATAEAAAEAKETVDLEPRKDEPEVRTVDEIEVTDVDVKEEIVTFRVNETLDMVTIGHGNHYDFEQGREYKAPKHIYDHLEEKGLVWH